MKYVSILKIMALCLSVSVPAISNAAALAPYLPSTKSPTKTLPTKEPTTEQKTTEPTKEKKDSDAPVQMLPIDGQ